MFLWEPGRTEPLDDGQPLADRPWWLLNFPAHVGSVTELSWSPVLYGTLATSAVAWAEAEEADLRAVLAAGLAGGDEAEAAERSAWRRPCVSVWRPREERLPPVASGLPAAAAVWAGGAAGGGV